MRLYIAGPMTFKRHFNFETFDDARDMLARYGYDPVSPADLDGPEVREAVMLSETGDPADLPPGMTHGDFLARDVKEIADGGIDGIVCLPGWENSSGARHETFVAFLKGLPVYTPHEFEINPYSEYHPQDLELELRPVSNIRLFKAWTQEPGLLIYRAPFQQEVES